MSQSKRLRRCSNSRTVAARPRVGGRAEPVRLMIVVRFDVMMARRESGKVKGARFSTLEAICRRLDCQRGETLEWVPDEGEERLNQANAPHAGTGPGPAAVVL